MKNIFKSRFSLIAICIVLGILIGTFALCGCRSSLLEGYTTEIGTAGTPYVPPPAAAVPAAAPADGNAITGSIATALQTLNPLDSMMPPKEEEEEEEEEVNVRQPSKPSRKRKKVMKESFQMSRPIAWAPIKGNESDDIQLSKWVSDAMKYSKGMGNENHLDSYEYNSGPPIPLPEGEMFFFKDTKFDSSCCPSTYTSSMGCACMSKKQFQHLTMRGGNNTIPETKTAYYNDF